MSKRALVVIIILAVLLLGVSFFANILMLSSHALGSTRSTHHLREEVLVRGASDSKIAQIDVEGLISSAGGIFGTLINDVKMKLDAATSDPQVKAIVVRVNSPGGEITASDVLYNAVKKAAAIKPVVVYLDSIGASGGYYLACGGTEIMANETTLTGSIGVIIQTYNYEDLLGKVGLQTLVFTSGVHKDMLSPARQMTPTERDLVQGMITETYERFLGIVSNAREIPAENLRNGVADGRVVTGRAALEEDLIDATGYLEDAYARAMELSNSQGSTVISYGRQIGLGQLLSLLGSASEHQGASGEQRITLELGDPLTPRLQPGMVYLLPASFASR